MEAINRLAQGNTAVASLVAGRETLWLNPGKIPFEKAAAGLDFKPQQIQDGADRFQRFAPFLAACFPETAEQGGIIESPLRDIPSMRGLLKLACPSISGRLLLKMDSHLAVAGSIKARGGIYEVLCHTEKLALAGGIIKDGVGYETLAHHKDYFGKYAIHVGSTGNLGLSIGIISAAIGYRVTVHMSREAKGWKKDLLRQHGVTVVEYSGDFSQAVQGGRAVSKADPNAYFVDDENSVNLFMGYAVAAKRLKAQLVSQGVLVDPTHPLFVYLPCGVGGAPGGVTFGLKHLFGDSVHCFFVEPVTCPSMLVGMATGLHDQVCVADIGLSGKTAADGLAVGRPSKLVGSVMEPLLSGIFTLEDKGLFHRIRELFSSEGVFIEPSAGSAFGGLLGLFTLPQGKEYIKENQLEQYMENSTHIAWATGGALVPQAAREEFLNTYI